MRQIDKPETFGELKRVDKPKPPDKTPEWVPTRTPGIERNRQGQLRNTPRSPPDEAA